MDSSLIQIPSFVTLSIHVLMAIILKINVLEDSTSMNILEHVCGQRQQDVKDAKNRQKNFKTDSNVQKTRRRMMTQVKSSLIHTSHIQKIARNSTSVWTELNHVNLDVQQEKSSMMKLNVVTLQKMFQDGNFFQRFSSNFLLIKIFFLQRGLVQRKQKLKSLSKKLSITLFLLYSIHTSLYFLSLSNLLFMKFFLKTKEKVKKKSRSKPLCTFARLPIMEIIIL